MSRCKACSGPAQFLCGRCCTERYCSDECQKAAWNRHSKLCGLRTGVDEAGPEVDDDNVVGIITKDGRKFRITREEAMKFQTLSALLQDITNNNDYIPLPSVGADAFMGLISMVRDNYFDKLSAAIYLNNEDILRELYKDLVRRLLNKKQKIHEFKHVRLYGICLSNNRAELEALREYIWNDDSDDELSDDVFFIEQMLEISEDKSRPPRFETDYFNLRLDMLKEFKRHDVFAFLMRDPNISKDAVLAWLTTRMDAWWIKDINRFLAKVAENDIPEWLRAEIGKM